MSSHILLKHFNNFGNIKKSIFGIDGNALSKRSGLIEYESSEIANAVVARFEKFPTNVSIITRDDLINRF